MRVAVVGGTGSFGLALARRLADAGYDVVVGSRDAGRAAEAAAGLGVEGATNEDACRAADLVVLATKADAAVDTARELRKAIGTTPVLSVAAELVFSPQGVLPTTEATSVAARIQAGLDGPVIAGLHSLAARNLGGDGPPEEDVLVCGDDEEAKAARAGARRADHLRSRGRLRPARVRPCARGLDGGDRERQQALQGACGRTPLGPALARTGRRCREPPQRAPIRGSRRDTARGLPELEESDDLGLLLHAAAERAGGLEDGDVVVVAQKAVSKVEGRVVRLRGRRAFRAGDRARRAATATRATSR